VEVQVLPPKYSGGTLAKIINMPIRGDTPKGLLQNALNEAANYKHVFIVAVTEEGGRVETWATTHAPHGLAMAGLILNDMSLSAVRGEIFEEG
jgi:hypothetical protein